MTTKIKMFGTCNDTDKWAVCVDGYFGLFADKVSAERVYDMIGGTDGSDGLADTAFGSCCILSPGYRPNIGEWEQWQGGMDYISLHRAISIEDYIVKTPIRLNYKVLPQTSTVKDRLQLKRFFGDMLGNLY